VRTYRSERGHQDRDKAKAGVRGDTRVYWLIELRRAGTRVPVYPTLYAQLQAATSFPATVAAPAHEVYFAALKNGETDNFFGPVVTAQPVERTLTL